MSADLKASIRKALAGSSSQQPVDTDTLYKLGVRKRVQDALLEMYRQQEMCCVLITRHGVSKSVWWLSGKAIQPHSYGRTGRGIR